MHGPGQPSGAADHSVRGPDAIGRMADGMVLVIAADASKRDIAVNTKMLLDAANIPILGAVLNRRTFPIPDKIYRYL